MMQYLLFASTLWILYQTTNSSPESAEGATLTASRQRGLGDEGQDVIEADKASDEDAASGAPQISIRLHTSSTLESSFPPCPSNLECSLLGGECLSCDFDTDRNFTCNYGQPANVTCQPKHESIACNGPRTFVKTMTCQYCYQTSEGTDHTCDKSVLAGCDVIAAPHYLNMRVTNCTVRSDLVCMGHRTFQKRLPCNWSSGHRWTTALALSITLGGFGCDRFYLGHWKEGIGKLFSFGGLGVWTLVDIILIAIGYVGPADGSFYIY